MKMKKTYYLNKDVLPTIPVPHDCIIKKIRIEHKWLIFTFDMIHPIMILSENLAQTSGI